MKRGDGTIGRAVLTVGVAMLTVGVWAWVTRPPGMPDEPEQTETQRRLDAVIPQIAIHAKSLREAMEQFGGITGIPIRADWKEVERVYKRDFPIDLELTNLPARRILEILVTLLTNKLRYHLEGEVLVLTAKVAPSPEAAVMRMYDVADLMEADTALRREVMPLGGGRLRLSHAGELAVMPEELSQLIEESPVPDTWRSQVYVGEVRRVGTKLIVMQTAENHTRIEWLLRMLRSGSARSGKPTRR